MTWRSVWIISVACVSQSPTVQSTTATMATAWSSPTYSSVTATTAGPRCTVMCLALTRVRRLPASLMSTLPPLSFQLSSEFFSSVSFVFINTGLVKILLKPVAKQQHAFFRSDTIFCGRPLDLWPSGLRIGMPFTRASGRKVCINCGFFTSICFGVIFCFFFSQEPMCT